jgi:hypothetical protein
MCFTPKTPSLQSAPAPEATPTAPVVNGSDASGNNIVKSKAQGVNSLKIPLNVTPAGNGLQIPQ